MKSILLKFLTFVSVGIIFAGCANQVNTPVGQNPASYTKEVVLDVQDSIPQYKIVTIRTPYQDCWDEEVPVKVNDSDVMVGALIGGIAGGILGHQVGGGSGKDVATVGGAFLGTIIGSKLAQNQNPEVRYQTQRRCVTKYDEKTTDRFINYKNIAYYNGQAIIRYSDRPLRKIRLRVSVNY